MTKSRRPLVSVIVPTRNEEQNIKDCLEAIHRQTYRKSETIVVDGGSKDNTVSIALEKGAKVIYERPARGPANARNIGAKSAHGEIMFFVDADVILKKNTITKLVEFMNKNKLDAVIPLTWIYPTKEFMPQLYFAERLSSRLDLSPNFFKKEIFLKTKFDQSLGVGEDVDIRERLNRVGAKIGFAKNVIAYHKEPNINKIISEAKWWGRTYPSLLKKGYVKVLASTIWIFVVASILPLLVLSKYFELASSILFVILLIYLPYSIYKIAKSIRNGAKSEFALLLPLFKIFKYSIFSFYILRGLIIKESFKGR